MQEKARQRPREEPLSPQQIAQQVVEEARMVLPGIQALFGFQLIAVFNARFTELSFPNQVLHFASMLLVALATALIMTPAAYHRQVEQAHASWHFVRLASWLITLAMASLILGLSLDVYVLAALIFQSAIAAVSVASGLFLVFVYLWFIFPRAAHRGPNREAEDD